MDDLKLIKDKYGEKMMHLCRELFPTIIDNNPGVLAVGLAVDLIGSVVYYKTVRKVDLKLA